MTKKRKLKVVAGILVAALLLGIGFIAVAEPQTAVGYIWFRTWYRLAPDRAGMLQGYDANLWANNGGYIPESVDNFLCSRLSKSPAQPKSPAQKEAIAIDEAVAIDEMAAITDFYAFKAGGREGRVIYKMSVEAKQRVIGVLLSRIDGYSPRNAARALVLIEVLRQGHYLGKANLISNERTSFGSTEKWDSWWEEKALPRAITQFKSWWSRPESWAQKQSKNPLANSPFQIVAP